MNNEMLEKLEAEFDDLFPDLDEDTVFGEEDNVIVLNDENGNQIKFEFMDLIEFENQEYVVLLPIDDSEDSEQVVILKFSECGDQEEFESVEDENVLQAVFNIFKDKFRDEFNFVD